jgi:hypothetical protein
LPDGSTTVLAPKVAVACDAARRFAVGDPAIQRFDVLVGATTPTIDRIHQSPGFIMPMIVICTQ